MRDRRAQGGGALADPQGSVAFTRRGGCEGHRAMKYKPNLPESAERMRRFWYLEEPLDRVPCKVMLPEPPFEGMMLDGTFFGNLEGYLAWREEWSRRQSQVPDDWLPIVNPQYGHALISALCGSPIRGAARTVWSVPIITAWEQLDTLRLDFDSEYGRRFRADYEFLLEWAHGKCGVAHYEVEGVADTMSALRGAERLCFDYVEAPEQVHRFAARVAEMLAEFAFWCQANVDARQDVGGGVATYYGLWGVPGMIETAEDATVMIAPETYREFIQGPQRRLTSQFSRALLEVHPEGNHQLPAFAEVEGVTALACQNPLDMEPHYQEVALSLRGRKAFYTGGSPDELEATLALLGTRGVFLGTQVDTVEEARALLRDLEKWTAKYRREEENA